MYDRCNNCKSPMYFHAVTIVKGVWRRWMECQRCGLLTHADEYGMMILQSKTPPTKGAIGKGE